MYGRNNPSKGPCIGDVSDVIDFAQANFAHSRYENVRDLDSARNVENRHKNQAQLFLARLLAPSLAGRSRFRLVVG